MPEKDFEVIKKEIKKLVAGITLVPVEKLTDEARFTEDLNVDSMMALEIVASIEKKFKVIIPEDDIPKVRSLANVYEMLEPLLK